MAKVAEMDDRGKSTGAQTVSRAMSVLACFRETTGTIAVAEIARRLDLNVSAVYRIVRALDDAGLLEQDDATRRYRLGTAVAGLNRVLYHQRRFHLARPELHRLATRVHGAAALAIRDGAQALVVGDVPAAAGPEGWDTEIADAVPLHVTALGKVLLAWSHPSDADLAALGPLSALTPHSITDVAALQADLARTRERGYAIADRELSGSQLMIAAPILDAEGRSYLAAGVGVAWSPDHQSRIPEIAEHVQASARRLRDLLVPFPA